MKKVIFFLILFLPFNVFALSFSPKECLTIEVGDSIDKLYDYVYYTYNATGSHPATYCYCSTTCICQVMFDNIFSNQTWSGVAVDYKYLTSSNIYWRPVGSETSQNVQYYQYTFDYSDNGNFALNGSRTSTATSFGSISTGRRIISYNDIYTSIDKTQLYDYESVSGHSVITYQDIIDKYANMECPSTGGDSGGSINIDYSSSYLIALILMVFFLLWFLRWCFPMKGGKNL